MFSSSTKSIPQTSNNPRHIAIIMDGNGRWAKKRLLPRVAGHRRGVESVRDMIKACIERDIGFLTLFAFSSENWRRPADEVSFLMQLFIRALQEEIAKLHENGVCFKVIGDLSRFDTDLIQLIHNSQELTQSNTRLTLTIAVNYGGRWDIMQAMHAMLTEHPQLATTFTEDDFSPYLSMAYAPEPDLFIRTGGEQRISNFLLWQLAYAEFYFTDVLWPDFNADALQAAIVSYQQRERRFGRTSEQLINNAQT